ncbi:MAG: hypothetical protein ACREO2_09725 [Arenimonas sp.]
MLAASSAHAVPVADLPHTLQAYITHLMRYVRQGQEYAEQVEHHIRDVTHMRQQLITIPGLADVSMPMTDNFEERDPNYGMGAACPGAGSMSLSSLMSAFTLDLSGDIKEQQKQICQRIVLAKNTQYNEAVKMLKNVRQQDTQIKQIAAERAAAGESQGKLAANDNKLSQFLARSTASMQYSQTVITAYEAYINSLEDNQELLTKQAMTGNNGNETFATTVTRKFVQGVALEAALDSVSDRDR